MQYESLVKNFKENRINRSITQKELAERSGLSLRNISRFENGGDISVKNFIKLMEALSLSDNLNYLIPSQTDRPSYYVVERIGRKRASTKKKDTSDFVWGDEK